MSPRNDNYTIHKVSLKRTRQACGTCRRKKARCPGEKPTCSLCQRLGQRCMYGTQVAARSQTQAALDETGDRSVSASLDRAGASDARLQSMEQRLEELASLIKERLPETVSHAERLNDYFPTTHDDINQGDSTPNADQSLCHSAYDSPLHVALIVSAVHVYLNDFHDQPYCVFSKEWLLENKNELPPEIVFPLIALTRRLSVNFPDPIEGIPSTSSKCAERAWHLLSVKYCDGKTDLSFLQGTFLVAQLDFADGNVHRGCASVGLGLRVIQSNGLNHGKVLSSLDTSEAEAWRRITWAFFVLDRTYNASRNYSICLSDNHFTLPFPLTTVGDHSPRGFLHDKSPHHEQNGDLDILACLLRLYSLWGKVTEWVFEPLETSTLPPWHSGSSLAVLESEWMEFETRFANLHRYRNVDFKRRAREDPDSRQYLSTWLCVQFLFHSIQCLLHHPFVTMVKLRHMRGNLSAAFLQKSFESSLLHSRWIARFIREMTEVELRLCDPFVGYLAAIAATIQLEHTGNKNPKIALLLNSEYRVLVGFITGLSLQWGSMKVLVRRVNELASRHQNYGSLFYNQDGFSAQDEALMWDILDLTSCDSGPQSITKPPAATSITAEGPKPDIPTLGETVIGHIEPAIIDGATEDWPFDHRGLGLGTGVPDIPDWMIFEDFTSEHL
ncbi:hypothetical protein N7454_003783 [Penicillium verhagenii]|nr:hypothetical protein N7454_003783 [Penicillium verhagenii]